MRGASLLVIALTALGACTPRIAQTAEEPAPAGGSSSGGTTGTGGSGMGGAGAAPSGGAGAAPSGGAGAAAGSGGDSMGGGGGACPPDLKDRITTTVIDDLDDDIRYKRAAYDYAPLDNRIALSLNANGGYVAWVNNALTKVHVTPLGPELTRSGPDVVVDGADVGGLVAHDDGFALLLRRTDPGEQLTEPSMKKIATAVVLLRYKDGAEVFSATLTGTQQINAAQTAEQKRDCAPRPFQGRLAHNGSRYGAYFFVAGCDGHPRASYYGDKLIYVDDAGTYAGGGWSWNCGASKDLRMLPEASAFMALCMSDWSETASATETLKQAGMNLVVEGSRPLLLAEEFAEHGYNGSPFGSLLKLADGGYFVGWLSRGKTPGTAPADPAFLRLGPDRAVTAPFKKLLTTTAAEMNLHFAPYGPDRLLMIWDSIDTPRCDTHTCLGTYSGTHLRLIDPAGAFLTEDVVVNDVPPNTEDDLAVFPNGDVGWAFVPESPRNYSKTYTASGLYDPPVAPLQRTFTVARLRNCR